MQDALQAGSDEDPSPDHEINFQDGDAFTLIKWMRKKNPNLIALIVTGEADLPSAITAIKLGFADYLEKPVSMKECRTRF